MKKNNLSDFFFSIKFIFLIALFFRLAIVVFNYITGSNSFIGPDSYGLFHTARMLSTEEIDFLIEKKYFHNNFFLFIVPLIFKVLSIKSYTVASFISILLWILSFALILKIFKNFCVEKIYQIFLLSIFSFWPSIILFTSAVSREAFQIFFLILSIYFLLNLIKKKNLNFLFLIITLFILLLLHKALFFTSFFIFLIAVFYLIKNNQFNRIFKFILVFCFVIFCLMIFINYTRFGYTQFIYGIPAAINIYQNGLLIESDLRANFRDFPINIGNYYDLLIHMIIFLKDYFFSPYLNQIFYISDILALVENYFRLLLIVILTINITNSISNNKISIIIFLVYLLLEFTWAMGTSNWGTAMRHHTVANAILLISLGLTYSKKNYERKTSN